MLKEKKIIPKNDSITNHSTKDRLLYFSSTRLRTSDRSTACDGGGGGDGGVSIYIFLSRYSGPSTSTIDPISSHQILRLV